jgi:hypothetical protein
MGVGESLPGRAFRLTGFGQNRATAWPPERLAKIWRKILGKI